MLNKKLFIVSALVVASLMCFFLFYHYGVLCFLLSDFKKNFSNWLVAIGTFCAVIVALFNNFIWEKFRRPKLKVRILNEYPDCVLTKKQSGEYSYFARVCVENYGYSAARKVEVYINSMQKKDESGLFVEEEKFEPINLRWSSIGGMYLDRLSPDMKRHFDFIDLFDKREQLKLQSYICSSVVAFWLGLGVYRFEIMIGAENMRKSFRVMIEVNYLKEFHYTDANVLYGVKYSSPMIITVIDQK
jgi:hypothetical protein